MLTEDSDSVKQIMHHHLQVSAGFLHHQYLNLQPFLTLTVLTILSCEGGTSDITPSGQIFLETILEVTSTTSQTLKFGC